MRVTIPNTYVTTSITHYEGKVVFGQIDPISLTSILSFGTFVLALVLFLIIKNKKKKQS